MKKLLFFGILMVGTYAHARELRSQYRIWKSSSLSVGNYSNVLISSSPIIFHMVVGSPTVNISGFSYFALHQSTGTSFTTDSSTKIFISLDETAAKNSGMGSPFDVICATNSFFTKQGGAVINYLWDYLNEVGNFNKSPLE